MLKELTKKQIVMLAAAPLLVISTIAAFQVCTSNYGKTTGYILGFCFYWLIWCLILPMLIVGTSNIKNLYKIKAPAFGKPAILNIVLTIFPFILTGTVVFSRIADKINANVIVYALIFALINGSMEELFWRGTFNAVFENNIWLSYIYPTIFFGAWHIALYLVKDISYQGGFLSLVGGATIMGFAWGWAAWRSNTITFTTAAHILTNFFAFSGLIFENWFM